MKLDGKLRIATQKSGRLSEGSLGLLRKMGLQFETSQDGLFTSCRNLPIDILFLRDDDIPEYVQDGVAQLGIVGSNVIEERSLEVQRLLPLDFGFCALSIAVPEQGPYASVEDLHGKRIATCYPQMLRRFLNCKKIEADLVLLKGCVEIAPALQVADAICDLVATGTALRTNRLNVIETVSQCQAVLIGNQHKAEHGELIEELLLRARGVQEARRYKYVMFNAPQEALEPIKKLVPGCKSPTVIPLAEPGFIAIHSLVLEESFWDVVDKIRDCGGRDIIVSSVEKLIR